MTTNYFLQTLQHLRQYEEILLFSNLHEITAGMQEEMTAWAEKEFNTEKPGYPGQPPAFHADAALWAGKIVYTAAQLLLYREHKEEDLQTLFPAFNGKATADAMISADIFLRFLPDIVKCLEGIDHDDKLIAILEIHLHTWHYSAVHLKMNTDDLLWDAITSSSCLYTLYLDRIIANKRSDLGELSVFRGALNAALGMHAHIFWKEYITETITINGNDQ